MPDPVVPPQPEIESDETDQDDIGREEFSAILKEIQRLAERPIPAPIVNVAAPIIPQESEEAEAKPARKWRVEIERDNTPDQRMKSFTIEAIE